MAMPPSILQPGLSPWPHRSSLIGSAQASPSVHSISNSGSQLSTISSLQGSYVCIVVQVTRDFHPVVYSEWLLPESNFDLFVSDVTLEQFERLGNRLGRGVEAISASRANDWDWPSLLSHSMISLAQLLKVYLCNRQLSARGFIHLPFSCYPYKST